MRQLDFSLRHSLGWGGFGRALSKREFGERGMLFGFVQDPGKGLAPLKSSLKVHIVRPSVIYHRL